MPEMPNSRWIGFSRAHPWLIGIVVLILAVIVIFDWSWLRRPLESYVSKKTQRAFTISDFDVKLGLEPTIVLQDLVFGNSDWGKPEPMATAKKVEFSVALRDLLEGKILLPRVTLTDARILMERLKDDRINWTLSDPSDTSPSRFRMGAISVNNGQLEYFDYGIPFALTVDASTFDPAVQDNVKDAEAKPENTRYSARFKFAGKYRDATFAGNALTGEVMSVQETGIPFPLKGTLVAGTTKLEVEGTVADAANISGIDVDLRIAGQTMANLYPFLLLPLPASPPYDLRGHLVFKGNKYTLEKLKGKIGTTDVQGRAAYVVREPRPLLTAELHSKLVNMADLGPLVGIKTKASMGKPKTTQAETSTQAEAAAAERRQNVERILPTGSFEGSRLQAIDAEVTLETKQLKATDLPFDDMRAVLKLHDAVLQLVPLELGFAGGTIISQITLDARQPIIKASIQTDVRRLQLNRLVPENPEFAKAAGTIGGKIDLRGAGNSIADMAAKSDGHLSAVVAGGRISNLRDALTGLNGGKALQLLVRGDQDIAVRCGAVAFDVKAGRGTSSVFVVDTEQTQITGAGSFDFAQERLDMKIEPRPKRPGILSLRTPIRVYGSFRDPEIALEKGPLALRGGAAVALALINPLAALIPLIETGSGVDTDCKEVSMPKSSSPSDQAVRERRLETGRATVR